MHAAKPRHLIRTSFDFTHQCIIPQYFARLPRNVPERARFAYKRFQIAPFHSGLHFKAVRTTLPLWSVRINNSFRAVGVRKNENEII